MSNWRDTILRDFVPKVSKLTLVADPDNLLTEERLALELRRRGFDLVEFNDAVEFRYSYESKYRSIWDRGEHTDLVVILRLEDSELDSLPYDLLQTGRKLSFNLGELFPNLSYPVIEKLDRSLLDPVFAAQPKVSSDRMGDKATKDFILRHVFGVAAELIANDVDLLRALLRIHYGKMDIPEILGNRLVNSLRETRRFESWPLTGIVLNSHSFYGFLQERWPVFLKNLGAGTESVDEPLGGECRYPGPTHIPFDHQDIRIYIDNLFVEGKLSPVSIPEVRLASSGAFDLKDRTASWIRSGIVKNAADDTAVRMNRLFAILEKKLPGTESRYSDWVEFALQWAELLALMHERAGSGGCLKGDLSPKAATIQEFASCVDGAFSSWLVAHYASLLNLPPSHPVMLHHIPRHLARTLEEGDTDRVALVVVDGLSLDQWVKLRKVLHKDKPHLVPWESAIFAWIPTLTSVSRQALFSGKPPIYFPSSIDSTNNEGRLWKQFWVDFGMSRLDIGYKRGLGDAPAATGRRPTTSDIENLLDQSIHPGKTRVIGLVVDTVDRIMHGMQLGAVGMHNQVEQWAHRGLLGALIDYLLDRGYGVWLTADHGNIEAEGQGRPSEGVIAETRGERARIYHTPELRTDVASACPFAEEWEPVGLPLGYYPLLANHRNAFSTAGRSIVAHGGASIEEVIVPLIKFEKRNPE